MFKALLVLVALVVAAPSPGATAPRLDAAEPQDRRLREVVRELSKLKDDAPSALFEELVGLGGKASFDALRKSLRSLSSVETRGAAYRAFHGYATDEALGPASLEFLGDEAEEAKKPEWRLEALRALVLFGEDAVERLEPMAGGHRDAACRTIATDRLLLRLDERGDGLGLRTILENASLSQVAGVDYLGVSEASKKRAENRTHRAVIRELLGRRLTGETLPLFAERLASRDAGRIWKLVLLRLVAARPGGDSGAVLARTCGDSDAAVALLAIDLLLEREDNGLRERTLRPLLASPEAALRRAAVIGLGRVRGKDPAFEAEALGFARSRDAAIRMGGARALVDVHSPAALEALHALLLDAEWAVRVEALRRISEWRDKASIPVLIARFAAETGRLTEDVRAALVRVTRIDLGRQPASWQRWWEAEGERFVVPPADAREVVDQGAEPDPSQSAAKSFYRIRVLSERVGFVLDVSGSMRTRSERSVGALEVTRMDVAKEELTKVLRGLPDGTLFNVIFFETQIRPLEKKLIEMKKATRARALRFVREQYAVGATALFPALELAYADPLVDTIYLMSDGAPTVGSLTDIEEIRAEVGRWNATRHVKIHGIAMGQDSTLLGWLCDDSGGTYTRVD